MRWLLLLAIVLLVACDNPSGPDGHESAPPAFKVEARMDVALGCKVSWSAVASDPLKIVFYRISRGSTGTVTTGLKSGQFQGSVKVDLGTFLVGANRGVFLEWDLSADGYHKTEQEGLPC